MRICSSQVPQSRSPRSGVCISHPPGVLAFLRALPASEYDTTCHIHAFFVFVMF